MELRLGNQQRHSITAVLLSAVVVIFGLVLADTFSDSEPEPLGAQIGQIVTSSTSRDLSGDDSEASGSVIDGVARSNAAFTLNPDVTLNPDGTLAVPDASTTTSIVRRVATTAAVATTTASTATTATTTTTEPSSTSVSSTTETTLLTTTITEVDPPGRPSTTVDIGETTTTKKCRGNRPGCRKP